MRPLPPLPRPFDALAPIVGDRRGLPAPERAEPVVLLEDVRLPLSLAPVEPRSFGLACVQSAWGRDGIRN